jgi:tRNA A37 threonylcarbamoyladenosine biosynthesis protein TsaE
METMEEIGALISVVSKPADVILLDGDLGAGKTTFSRGFVHCKLGLFDDEYDESDDEQHDEDSNKSKQQKYNNEDTIRVTSPTYLLSNTYVYKDDDDDDDDQRIRE